MVWVHALRAVAALAVVIAHLPVPQEGVASAIPYARYGAVGVDLFFVISGFVMVLTSGSLFDADGPRVFGARRVARIVPAYWIATFAQAATYYAIGLGAVVTVEGMLTSLFFLPINHATTMVGVGWSLNSEMFFYLLFACALPLGRSRAVLVLSLLMTAFAVLGRSVPMPLPFSF